VTTPARPFALLAVLAALGATGGRMDSQYVLQRYASAIATAPAPKVVVFSYTVSQVGASNIEQHHRVYRSGLDVRDETLTIDGVPLSQKIVRFSQHEDHYTVGRFAPSPDAYELLFLGTAKDGRHLDYIYEATPLNRASATWVDRRTIDGASFLPRVVHFHTTGAQAEGSGVVEFAPFGNYWMPVLAKATARVKGKPASERIVWSDYRFPQSLPSSTFQAPRPLPIASIPPG
jgi:hypothetical protein